MINNLAFRRLTLLATLLLAFGLVPLAQAQKHYKSHHVQMTKHVKKDVSATGSIALLKEACQTLALADHDYKGHRVQAIKQIKSAIRELVGGTVRHHAKGKGHSNKHVKKHIKGRHHGKGKGHESQSVSDDRLRTAIGLLQQASNKLSGNALQKVSTAIGQLNTALSIR